MPKDLGRGAPITSAPCKEDGKNQDPLSYSYCDPREGWDTHSLNPAVSKRGGVWVDRGKPWLNGGGESE